MAKEETGSTSTPQPQGRHSVVLRNGTIVDGSGAPRFNGDVGVKDDRISALGAPGSLEADVVVDATDRIVAPGFVDIHSHADYTLLVDGRAHNCVLQGVTSVVTGNCGHGIAPVTDISRDLVPMNIPGWSTDWELPVTWDTFASYLETIRARGTAVNVFPLVAHGALRLAVAGFADRELSEGEIGSMRDMAEEAMAAGAVGLSTGLEYAPGIMAGIDEIAKVCEPVGDHDGIYATHSRNRAEAMIEAADEAIAVAEHAGARLQLSHFVRRPWAPAGIPDRAMDAVAQAAERGLTANFDVFPFAYGPTPLSYLLPPWAREGSREDIADRLSSAAVRRRILDGLGGNFKAALESDIAETMYIAADGHNSGLVGLTLGQVAKDRRVDVAEAALWVLQRAGANFYCTAIVERWVERDDLLAALSDPRFFIMGDGVSGALDGPLSDYVFTLSDWGYATAYLGQFVRGLGLVSLESAIMRMTSAPAAQAGLGNRGRVAEGWHADLVVFDPDTIDCAVTPDNLKTVSTGIYHVLVNGDFVVRDGRPTDYRPGTVGRGS